MNMFYEYVIGIFILAAWLTAVIHDIMNGLLGWTFLDVFFGIVGVFRGAMIWLGVI